MNSLHENITKYRFIVDAILDSQKGSSDFTLDTEVDILIYKTPEEIEQFIANAIGVEMEYIPYILFYFKNSHRLDDDLGLIRDIIKYLGKGYLKHRLVFELCQTFRQLSKQELSQATALLDEIRSLPNLGPTDIPVYEKSKLSRYFEGNSRLHHIRVSSDMRFYVMYRLLFKYLGLPLDGFKYWDFEASFDDNRSRLGFTDKRILGIALNHAFDQMHASESLRNFLTVPLLLRFLPVSAVAINALARNSICGFQSYQATANGMSPAISMLDVIMKSIPRHESFYDNDIYHEEEYMWSAVVGLWVRNYKSWLKRGGRVDIDGEPIYIHHHELIAQHARAMRSNPKSIRLPEKMNIKPSDFYADALISIATSKKKQMDSDYATITFPNLPVTLERLDPGKWVRLNTPQKLIAEGAIMSHCVGGKNYINYSIYGDVIYHYNDGSEYGYTIHLGLQGDQVPGNAWAGWDGKKGFKVAQIKGKHNSEPPHEVVQSMLDDLRSVCQYSGIDDPLIKQHLLTFRGYHKDFEPIFTQPIITSVPPNQQMLGRGLAGDGAFVVCDEFGNLIPAGLGQDFDGDQALPADDLVNVFLQRCPDLKPSGGPTLEFKKEKASQYKSIKAPYVQLLDIMGLEQATRAIFAVEAHRQTLASKANVLIPVMLAKLADHFMYGIHSQDTVSKALAEVTNLRSYCFSKNIVAMTRVSRAHMLPLSTYRKPSPPTITKFLINTEYRIPVVFDGRLRSSNVVDFNSRLIKLLYGINGVGEYLINRHTVTIDDLYHKWDNVVTINYHEGFLNAS